MEKLFAEGTKRDVSRLMMMITFLLLLAKHSAEGEACWLIGNLEAKNSSFHSKNPITTCSSRTGMCVSVYEKFIILLPFHKMLFMLHLNIHITHRWISSTFLCRRECEKQKVLLSWRWNSMIEGNASNLISHGLFGERSPGRVSSKVENKIKVIIVLLTRMTVPEVTQCTNIFHRLNRTVFRPHLDTPSCLRLMVLLK